MYYTFFNIIKKISKWYIEGLKESETYIDNNEVDTLEDDYFDEEIDSGFDDYMEELDCDNDIYDLTEDEKMEYMGVNSNPFCNMKALDYVFDKLIDISKKDYREYLNTISILLLEFFNLSYDNKLNDQDEIIALMNKKNKQELISMITFENNDYLIDILKMIITSYDFENELVEYNYSGMEYCLSFEEGRNMYTKFHPNLKIEANNFNKFMDDKKILYKIKSIDIDSLFTFINLFTISKVNIKSKFDVIDIFSDKLDLLKKSNSKAYNQIYSFIISFYFVLAKNDKIALSIDDEDLIIDLEENNFKNFYKKTSAQFLLNKIFDFDLFEYFRYINNISEEEKQIVKKLTPYAY